MWCYMPRPTKTLEKDKTIHRILISCGKPFITVFGKDAVFLFRCHHLSSERTADARIIDVTEYPDMQGLLLISDMLITDYSSSIWDFSFTGRPCFLFVPDLDKYSSYRGLDTDIHNWGFPVCTDNSSLSNAIRDFDSERFNCAMDRHHSDLGSFEEGNATERLCAFLAERLHIESGQEQIQ